MAPFRPAARLPIAAALGETSLMFPCHHTIDAETAERFADLLAETLVKIAEQVARRGATRISG